MKTKAQKRSEAIERARYFHKVARLEERRGISLTEYLDLFRPKEEKNHGLT